MGIFIRLKIPFITMDIDIAESAEGRWGPGVTPKLKPKEPCDDSRIPPSLPCFSPFLCFMYCGQKVIPLEPARPDSTEAFSNVLPGAPSYRPAVHAKQMKMFVVARCRAHNECVAVITSLEAFAPVIPKAVSRELHHISRLKLLLHG